ncbi:hybrid sensor histidine kinase/response regulator [Paractinoplanes abujensis]|uniref:histidine kinase n=1 Tax=Paractinoplanes abujensis TaxID=882441 RepID=A0A7W7G052_9ACTN|nr:ATP-binding protein [Actinoplanes abujensis]MBB4691252.1 PAS domain S-box-containing protein [Actinoplanes abujensis]GID17333.1 hybrid sensor histidine kinase/response regulator [Actinoplanes abujensis]
MPRTAAEETIVPEQLYILGNLVIMVAYASIMTAILVPVIRAKQLWSNKLAVTTSMIFFSCAVGHGLHAFMAIRASQDGGHGHLQPGWEWPSAAWDLFTALVGVYYWTLRRSYKVLLGGSIFTSPGEQHRISEADAREQAARNAAEKHRATLAAVVEHTDDAIIGVNLEGRVTAWNRGAERLFGYNAGSAIGQPMSIFSGDSAAADQMAMIARVRHGERVHYEARRVHRNGSPLELSINMAPIRDTVGVVTGVSVTAREISALKAAADERRADEDRAHQVQRMESLGKLAGGLAHDFNNILGIIVNYTEFAIDETADKPAVREDLEHVRAAADRAQDLTRQLQTFTRGAGGRPVDVDLTVALEDARARLEPLVGENITIVARPGPGPMIVHADPGQLQRVIEQLATNARDAMPDGGTLVLEADIAGDQARLLVSDTGTGMPPDVADRVFEPFFTTKAGKGAGMGLAAAYGMVTEAGGTIAVYSEPGVGTTFRVNLPLVKVMTAPETGTLPPSGDGRTILVVEHEPALMRAATRILTVAGYRVIAAATGPEALVVVGDRTVDALITDVVMPDMTGPRLAELLHERAPTLPVIFMSGYSSGMLDATGQLDPAAPFVEKPFTAHDLLTTVHRALHRTPSAV